MDKDLKQALLEIRKQKALAEVQAAKTEAQIERTEAQIAKTERQVEKTNQTVERFIGNYSYRAEQFFIKAIKKQALKIGDFQFDELYPNFTKQSRHSGIEIDALLVNSRVVAIVEIKTTLHPNDIERMSDKIKRFRQQCPNYNELKLLVVVAGETVYQESKEKALEEGYVVLESDHEKMKMDLSSHRLFA